MTPQVLQACIAAFLLGSVPFGYLIARTRGVDIRTVGSGNIGATNVTRALGRQAGLLVLALDVAKGLAPTLLARLALGLSAEWALVVGIAAVLGHCFSPFLGFRGGKGIATLLGATLGATPAVALAGLVVFGAMFGVTRIVSLSSIVAAFAALLAAYLLRIGSLGVGVYTAAWFFIIYRHRANIGRLIRGEEPRLTLSGNGRGGSPKAKREPEVITLEAEKAQKEAEGKL